VHSKDVVNIALNIHTKRIKGYHLQDQNSDRRSNGVTLRHPEGLSGSQAVTPGPQGNKSSSLPAIAHAGTKLLQDRLTAGATAL
jgi:hypothetical protein